MPFEQSIQDAMQLAKQIRIHVLEGVNAEQARFGDTREDQVKLMQEERSKLNFLAFAIAGSVLGFSPDSLQNTWVVIGLMIILINAFLFGFIADALQRRLNVRNAEEGLAEMKQIVTPYFDAYDEVGKYLDDPAFSREGFQAKYDKLQLSYITYLETHKQKTAKPRLAKRTRLGIGYWYFIFYSAGLIIMGAGLVTRYDAGHLVSPAVVLLR